MSKQLKEIVNGEFINIVYDNEIYLLVDEFKYNNKCISYFNSLHGDLFCYKKDHTYEIIEDENICEKVREDNDLYIEYYLYLNKFINSNNSKEITGGERKLLIENFISDLSNLCKVNRGDIHRLLKDTVFKKSNNMNAYNILSNTIYLKDYSKHNVVFHEIVHALTNKNYKTNFIIGHGLLEGYASLLTNKLYAKRISGIYNGLEYNFEPHIVGNCNECMAVVSQLEFILGEDISKYMFDTDINIIKKVCDKTSLNTYLYIRRKLNKIYKNYRKNINSNKELYEVQDVLLRNTFDKEFKNIKNIKDAFYYFDKLNDLGYYRARLNGKDKELETYFNKKLNECNKLLNTTFNIKYHDVRFNNRYLEYEYDKRILNDMKSYININKKDEVYDLNVYKYIKNDKVYGLFAINGMPLFVKEYDLNGSRKVNIHIDLAEAEEIANNEEIIKKR